MSALTDLSSYLSCSVGNAPAFQMQDYELEITPVVVKNQGSVGNKIKLTIWGWIQADTPAAADAAVIAFTNQPSGQDVIITGIGGAASEIILSIPAAECMDGGPDFATKILRGGNASRKLVQLIATATTAPDSTDKNGHPIPTKQSVKSRTATRADNVLTITSSGTLLGVNALFIFNGLLNAFNATYAWPNWVVSYEKTATNNSTINTSTGAPVGNPDVLTMEFSLTAQQLAGELPGGVVNAVDGEITTSVDRDEQHRKTTVTRCDLVVGKGTDPQQLVTLIRPAGQIYRENVSVTRIKELRIVASFTVLSGTDNALLNFQQRLEIEDQFDVWTERRYEGAAPVAVLAPTAIARFTQSGSATALGAFFVPPAPLTKTFSAQPRVTFEVENDFENVTTWNYPLLWLDGQLVHAIAALLGQIGRPAVPQFYNASGGYFSVQPNSPRLTGGGTTTGVGPTGYGGLNT